MNSHIQTDALIAFQPRKTPIQRRSGFTVETILEAAIQVLLSHGAERLTTTRIAERRCFGRNTVPVLYEQAVVAVAVLERHLSKVSATIETACKRARHKPLTEMITVDGGLSITC